jgi:hypothetical protein
MLEFLSRTVVQSEKELLSNLEEAVNQPQLQPNDSGSLTEFRRIIAKVQRNERSTLRQTRINEPVKDIQAPTTGISITRIQALSRHSESQLHSQPQSPSQSSSLPQSQSPVVDWSSDSALALDLDFEYGSGEQSGIALRGLLKELNDWLSADQISRDHNRLQDQAQFETTRMRALTEESAPPHRFGFENSRDWNYSASIKAAQNGQPERVRSKLSHLLEAARRMVVGVKNLPLGRRIESHENGAILEKDELGRVTQIRAQSGEIISVYYGRDGAPEGFVRTDARGVLHSVAECDAQGVVLRDENGRVRAAGDSLSIDPLGRISICRSDGQYWSIDLARQMLSEKRRLADPTGQWTALTAVFAADGFRMMTLFQKLTPAPGKSTVRSQDDANRIWSRAAVENGHFRFYGRDGSTIEFTSEEALASLVPAHVSSPGVRPIEPRWRARHQAGTAWQSVHEYVVSYLAV